MSKEKIIIFGRGAFFKAKKDSFLEKFDIAAFLDNSVTDNDIDNEMGLPVFNPKNIHSIPDYAIYCVSSDFISMWRQLIELGVKDERIKFGAMIPPIQEGMENVAFSNGERLFSENKGLYYESEVSGIKKIDSYEDIKEIAREAVGRENGNINCIKRLSTKPVSRVFGSERGKAVDRYYIEKFLCENSAVVRGRVLEIANNNYTLQFGGDRVTESVVSHVKGWGTGTILCNFESGEGVKDNEFDCIICTQTLQYIFDLQSAIRNIYRMLRPGGSVLITVPGIKPLCKYDNDHWGEQWSFTVKSVKKLCDSVCDEGDVSIKQYGNVKTATAYLYGVCVEELDISDFEYNDSQYPFIICAKITKRSK